MLVTTSQSPSLELLRMAERLASELGGRIVPRRRHSLARLRRLLGDPLVLQVTAEGLKLYADDESELFFHPGMALVRIKRLLGGDNDVMSDVSGVRPGDRVLDCTAGLCSDSLVFAYAAGPQGHVTALESEPLLHAIVREGLRSYETGLPAVDEAMRRIEPVREDHAQYLRRQPDNSFDIVYFDPMFRMPIRSSASISPLRGLANDNPLELSAVEDAKRVARRAVVLKENSRSGEFERLGFERAQRSTKIAYGVIRV